MTKSKEREQPQRRDDSVYTHETFYLVDWYFGAARNSLRLAGGEQDCSSPMIAHRFSAVFFTAAALEAWLGQMADEMFDGLRGGMNDHFEVLKALRETTRGADWQKKLSIYSWLWSTENRWTIAYEQPCVKVVGKLMQLRNELIHPRPHKRDVEGDRATSRYRVHQREHVQFGTESRDLPEEFLKKLSLKAIKEYIDAAEELVQRLRSIGVLHEDVDAVEKGLSSRAVLELDAVGSRTWTDRVNKIARQVRWCSETERYVMHSFPLTDDEVIRRANGEQLEPEERRACSAADGCRRLSACPWQSVRKP